ncbi:ABC transporter ATP-binding protein [Brachybacterium paraconglomeratum]|uniref:ABC transporter ATP-binding protein n=1 Tax=Brachybacterium paraconglomeratum TaxID=173362 RepID=UPI0031E8A80E
MTTLDQNPIPVGPPSGPGLTDQASIAPAAIAPTADPAADVVLEARGLSRRYGRGRDSYLAVDGVDLTLRRGELFGLLGTNGAGKTSTLEVLEGLARPTSGTVSVFGHDPYRERRAVRPRQGLMLQTGGFPADLTALEALTMWSRTLSTPRPVLDVLADVDLTDRAGTRISSLSGGEVRRLDLAAAIAGDPELLFLDEPTTGLDPESRARAWELIASLKARGTTIVLTTHYLDEAETLADRLAIMHRGRIAREGTVADVVAGHAARIRATLPASAPALPAVHGEALRSPEGHLEVSTTSLNEDLHTLLTWARGAGVELTGLDARAASLESVFLEIASSTHTLEG